MSWNPFVLEASSYPKALVENSLLSGRKGEPDWYEQTYKDMQFREANLQSIKRTGELVYKYKQRYQLVELTTGTPWYLVGAIHSLESGTDFRACLHNGERIIGTGRKTRLVPRGRGPFSTWEDAAQDALGLDGLAKGKDFQWSLGLILQYAERYNGLGYLRHHPDQNSPYIWACSDKCRLYGKYTSDGSYSSVARTDGQVGAAVIFKYLENQGYISFTPKQVQP